MLALPLILLAQLPTGALSEATEAATATPTLDMPLLSLSSLREGNRRLSTPLDFVLVDLPPSPGAPAEPEGQGELPPPSPGIPLGDLFRPPEDGYEFADDLYYNYYNYYSDMYYFDHQDAAFPRADDDAARGEYDRLHQHATFDEPPYLPALYGYYLNAEYYGYDAADGYYDIMQRCSRICNTLYPDRAQDGLFYQCYNDMSTDATLYDTPMEDEEFDDYYGIYYGNYVDAIVGHASSEIDVRYTSKCYAKECSALFPVASQPGQFFDCFDKKASAYFDNYLFSYFDDDTSASAHYDLLQRYSRACVALCPDSSEGKQYFQCFDMLASDESLSCFHRYSGYYGSDYSDDGYAQHDVPLPYARFTKYLDFCQTAYLPGEEDDWQFFECYDDLAYSKSSLIGREVGELTETALYKDDESVHWQLYSSDSNEEINIFECLILYLKSWGVELLAGAAPVTDRNATMPHRNLRAMRRAEIIMP
jgi:hypothetical protein